MTKQCPQCGAMISDNAAFCEKCGAPQTAAPAEQPAAVQPEAAQTQPQHPAFTPQKPSFMLNIPKDPVALTAVVFASLLFLLSFIIMLVDSSTFLNRLYTTALLWQIPLLTIVMIIYIFVKREGESRILGYIAAVLMALTFIFTNYSKNIIQDTISNVDNYVDIAAEAVVDNIDKVRDWEDVMEDAARKAMKSKHDYDEDFDW